MRFYQSLRRLRYDTRRSHPSRARQARRFEVEGLEARALLSILFTPQHGAETANYGGGPLLGTVSPGMPIYTIYWGSYWATSAGQTLQSQTQNSINPIFHNSGFLNGLHQYDVPYPAFVPGGSGTVEVNNYSNPPSGFTGSEIQSVISYAISTQGLPDSNTYSNVGLYVVFTPPGVTSSAAGDGGYHTYYTSGSNVRDYAWIGDVNSVGLNDYTYVMSKEVEGSMTDPEGNAWQVLPRNSSSWNEICDNEAQNYSAIINGYEVQSHWSQSDGAYAITDGNSQSVTDDDGSLYVYGDQLGTNYDDTIDVDLNSSGGVLITLNGQQFSFTDGEISHVYVYTEGGDNSVYVYDTSSISPVTIYGGGGDYDYIGGTNGVQGINGSVDVENPANYTDLVIDDTGNNFSDRSVTVDQTGVYGLAPAAITYNQNDLSALSIDTGSAGNTFIVDNTPDNGNGVYTYINNYSGAGSNDVFVYGTTGPLYLDGGAGYQEAWVTRGSLAAINGKVDVYNSSSSGSSYLIIDDSLDTTGRIANLYDGELTGLGASAPVYWSPTASLTGGVTDVAVLGGSGGNTFYVDNTSNLYFGTGLTTGSGSNTVDVYSTTGALTIDGRDGFNSVDVGVGSTAGISGSVDVIKSSSSGHSNLRVDDSADTTGRTANLYDGELTGLGASAPIYWTPTSTATGGVTYVAVDGGSGGNTFNVENTSNLYDWTVLSPGISSNTVNVYGTSGALYVDGGVGFDSVDVGVGSTAGILGSVNVNNTSGSSQLYVDDSLDTTGWAANLYNGELTGLGASAPIYWTPTSSPTGGVTYVAVDGGSGGNTFYVDNTSNLYDGTYIRSGSGGNTTYNSVEVYATSGSLDLDGGDSSQSVYVGVGLTAGIAGSVDVYNSSSSGYSSLYINDYSDTTGRIANLYDGELTGLGASAPVYWSPSASSTGGVTFVNVEGGSGGNTFYVHNTSSLYDFTYVYTGSGSNTVDVYGTTGALEVDGGTGFQSVDVGVGSMAAINGSVEVYNNYAGASGSSYLYIDDSSDTTGRIANLYDDKLTDLGELTGLGASAPVYWTPTSSLTGGVTYVAVDGGSGGNSFYVHNTSSLYNYTDLYTGSGSNTVDVTATTGALEIHGSGTDTLVGPNVASTWTISSSNAGSVGNITFAGVANLTGGSANDIFKFSNGKGVTGIVNGGAGTNTLNYSAYTTGVTVNLTTGVATGTGGVTNIENITGSPANDSLTGNSAANVISGDGGTDVLKGGTGGGDTFILASTQGAATTVTASGSNNTLDGANIANTWTLTGANAGNVNGIAFKDIQNLVGGTNTDTFKFNSAGSVSGTINGGTGSNTLNYSNHGATAITVNLQTDTATGTGSFAAIKTLVGGTGSNTLTGPNATNTWKITGTNAGNVAGVTFSAFQNLTGGTGMDIFKFSAGKNVTGAIKGGGGSDWLDYSSYTTPVTVNLQTGAATGVGTKVTNVHNVRGGQDGNTITGDAKGGILIGGAGVDTITGGSGRSILIGHKGADKVTGGSSDDIVIGGYTSYDGSSTANDQALEAILTEWQSSDSYSTRIAKITAGVSGAKFVWGITVLDDGAANTLTGSAGMNWFFKGAHDTITDLQSGEVVN